MFETPAALLGSWSSFYVMVGSSAAALTGLMFVVISVVMGRELPNSQDGIATFSTPTVLHFGAALLVSAVFVAPWHSVRYPAITVALIGAYGLAYISRVALRTRRFTAYHPDFEDWTWYAVQPFVGYAALFAGGVTFAITAWNAALFVIAGGTLLLLFIGIRNAWDVVTFIALGGGRSQ